MFDVVWLYSQSYWATFFVAVALQTPGQAVYSGARLGRLPSTSARDRLFDPGSLCVGLWIHYRQRMVRS